MNRLLLLDGNALLHRAYHALPPLTTSSGQPAGAVYGFISMMLKFQIDLHPSHYAVTFDRPAPTFRKQLYPEYQSQRPEMDTELVGQIQIVHDVVKAFGVRNFEMDGFEADDVIGTIVESIKASKHQSNKEAGIDQIIIVTGDRDILQLVEDDHVLLYMPVKGLSEAKLYGEKEVVERLGVMPSLIPDWKGLAGDASDNYPGVAGIGPKTAATLVNSYGSVEQLYEAIENNTAQISEKVKEKLVNGKKEAFLSKNLATIRKDVPIEIDEHLLTIETFDTPNVRDMLTTLGFPSLLKRMKITGSVDIKEEKDTKNDDKEKKKEHSSQMDLFS